MKPKIVPFDTNRKWFEVKNVTKESADVYLYDEIGMWGISASDVVAQLNAITAPKINLRINSPGGSVFDGFTIYNLLNQHAADITVYVDGLAASIASVIAMAGDEIVMADNAMLMIHEPWTVAVGTAADMRAQADLLDVLNGNIVALYAARSKQKPEDIAQMMKDETWMSAKDAKAKGFADKSTEAKSVAACFDLSGFKKTPANFSASRGDSVPSLSAMLERQAALEKSLP